MIKIDVWIQFADEANSMRAGEMHCADPDSRGRRQGAFRYASGYLNHPGAFALDPVRLPLSDAEFETAIPKGVFSVFEDSLPDD